MTSASSNMTVTMFAEALNSVISPWRYLPLLMLPASPDLPYYTILVTSNVSLLCYTTCFYGGRTNIGSSCAYLKE